MNMGRCLHHMWGFRWGDMESEPNNAVSAAAIGVGAGLHEKTPPGTAA